MVINTNSQPAIGANNLAISAQGKIKSAVQPRPTEPSDRAEVAITARNRDSIAPAEIGSEGAAVETAQFARNHILENPTGAVGVQANSRPEVVLELLQGILA